MPTMRKYDPPVISTKPIPHEFDQGNSVSAKKRARSVIYRHNAKTMAIYQADMDALDDAVSAAIGILNDMDLE
eukprot:1920837-Rhodomonas_salina.1